MNPDYVTNCVKGDDKMAGQRIVIFSDKGTDGMAIPAILTLPKGFELKWGKELQIGSSGSKIELYPGCKWTVRKGTYVIFLWFTRSRRIPGTEDELPTWRVIVGRKNARRYFETYFKHRQQ